MKSSPASSRRKKTRAKKPANKYPFLPKKLVYKYGFLWLPLLTTTKKSLLPLLLAFTCCATQGYPLHNLGQELEYGRPTQFDGSRATITVRAGRRYFWIPGPYDVALQNAGQYLRTSGEFTAHAGTVVIFVRSIGDVSGFPPIVAGSLREIHGRENKP